MTLPSTTIVLIVAIAALVNVLILAAAVVRVRAHRGRQLAEVEGYVSSSYRQGPPEPGYLRASDDDWSASEVGGHPTSRQTWSDVSDWPHPTWPGTSALIAGPAEAPAPDLEPFEYPEPTTLEQRAVADADAASEADDADADADWEDIDDDDPDLQNGAGSEHRRPVDEELTEEALDEPAAELDPERDEDEEPMMAMAADPMPDDGVHEPVPSTDATSEPSGPLTAITGGLGAATRGRDALTGMLDAAAFEEVMAQEEAREQRYGHPATVIVFELDGLAKLVDRLGTDPGDRIETALGDSIKRLARRADHVARLERGLYAVLLPETDEVAAINYVERIRRACDLWLESGAIAMRLAIGWASTTGDSGLTGAVRVATDRMRLELRRNARQAGDVAFDAEALDDTEQLRSASGS